MLRNKLKFLSFWKKKKIQHSFPDQVGMRMFGAPQYYGEDMGTSISIIKLAILSLPAYFFKQGNVSF